MQTGLTWRHRTPPPTLLIFFRDVQVAELKKESRDSSQVYVFRYLPAFRAQNLAPLPGLPDLDKTYSSLELWQYFTERIPDVRRPEIQALMKARKISQSDELQMLAELGAHSVSDPFEIRRAA